MFTGSVRLSCKFIGVPCVTVVMIWRIVVQERRDMKRESCRDCDVVYSMEGLTISRGLDRKIYSPEIEFLMHTSFISLCCCVLTVGSEGRVMKMRSQWLCL